jgi:hypothetical protein
VIRALDALRPLGSFNPLGALGSFNPLGALGSFYALGTFGALVSLHPRDSLGTVLAAIDAVLAAVLAAVFTAIFTPVGALLALGAQLDPEAIVVLAEPHALEVELARESLDGLGDLLALLRRQVALADAHVAHAAVEQRADLGDELLDVDRASGIAWHIEPNLFALTFALIFAPVLSPILASVFAPVLLPHIGGLRQRPDRLRQGRSQPDRCDGGCDKPSALHGYILSLVVPPERRATQGTCQKRLQVRERRPQWRHGLDASVARRCAER